MRKNTLLSVLLSMSALGCALGLTACDGLSGGGVVYTLSDDGTYAIVTNYTGKAGKVTIASEYEGVPVTRIDDEAFAQSAVTSIVIPDTITSVGGWVFAMTNMQYNVHEGCDYIGTANNPYYAFIQPADEDVTSVIMHENTKVIADYALNGYRVITDLYVPSEVITIGEDAFSFPDYIVNVTCPIEALDVLPSDSIHHMENLTLSTGTAIPDYAFRDWCLVNVVLPDSITAIGESAFDNCTSLESITFGNAFTEIGVSAFWGCSALTSFHIPESVTNIGNYAFQSCDSLIEIVIPDSVTNMGDGVFDECTSLTRVVLGNGITSIGDDLFNFCENLTEVTIPDNVTSIGSGAFYACERLTEIVIPNSVTEIGKDAFLSCTNLTKIVIPDSVTSIGVNAFDSCENATSAVIGDGLTSIAENTFRYCEKLESAVIGSAVTEIGESAFGDCTKLTKVYYKGTASEWAEISIHETGNESLKKAARYYYAETAQDVQKDGNTYWHYDENGDVAVWSLEEVFGTSGVLYDLSADGTFAAVTGYTGTASSVVIASVYQGAPVTLIMEAAFEDCTKLTKIVIPDSVTDIGNLAFSGCSKLATVMMGNSVKNINYSAFEGCTALTAIVLPVSVKSIGYGVFENCTGLTTIYYKGTASDWTGITIHNSHNEILTNAARYYYSAATPTDSGNYWHYDEDGNPIAW